jgi:hypothetical protein
VRRRAGRGHFAEEVLAIMLRPEAGCPEIAML